MFLTKHTNWSTQNEIDFLEGIKKRGKDHTLRMYIKASKTRTDWGKMKKDKILKRAKELLCT